jgi:type I restriction enzyme R subunit
MWQSMPNSVKVAFTGTPIDKTANTFGGYIDTYTMRQAVEDEVVVEIKYEGKATESTITDTEAMNNKFADIFGMVDSEEKAKILSRSVLKGYLENWSVIRNKANDMLDHFINTVFVNGFKAQVVAYSREAAYRYLKVFEELLPLKIEKLRENNPNNIDIEALERLRVACIISSSHNYEPHLKELGNDAKNEKIVDGFKMAYGETDEEGNDSNYGIIVVKSMLLTGFDAPIEQVMYLDQVIRGHNLLQAIARVNRTYGNNKKCGYVVDYIGVTNHLKDALTQYADADVDEILDVLKQHNEDIDKLHSSYLAFIQFIMEKLDVNSLDEISKIIEELIADPDLREEYNSHFRQFSKLFDRVLPDPHVLKYRDDYKIFSFIRQSVANSCRDPRLSMKDASKKVRAIIEEYLTVKGVDPKISPVSILSSAFGVEGKDKKSTRQKSDELTYAIREYININQPKDPEFFDRMSEKLEKLLKLLEDNWEELYRALEKIRQDDIIKGRACENTYGFDPQTEMPFFALIKTEIFGDKDYDTFTEEEFNQLKDVVTDILSTIKTNTLAINFWGNISLQKQLRTHIINHLLTNQFFRSIPSVFDNRKRIAQKIMELAYCHYGRN